MTRSVLKIEIKWERKMWLKLRIKRDHISYYLICIYVLSSKFNHIKNDNKQIFCQKQFYAEL